MYHHVFQVVTAIHKCGCGNEFGQCVSVYVRVLVDPLHAITVERRPRKFVLYASTSWEYLGQFYVSRSSGQGQGHRSKTDIRAQLNTRLRVCGPLSIV